MEGMPRAFLIDTDTASDDAVALIMALRAPDVHVAAITIVAGNVPLEQATRNALYTAELCGSSAPVYAGAARPLLREPRNAQWFHGADGLGDQGYPPPKRGQESRHAVDAIIDVISANPGIVLVTLGPLTNVALAVTRAPEIVANISRCVVMGGNPCTEGNITPAAEFNIYVDPEAAARVLGCGAPITMIPLDCTHQALTTGPRLEKLRSVGTPVAEAFYHLLKFNKIFDERKYGWEGGPLHDATVVAYLLAPHIFSGKTVNVEVECSSPRTLGMTVVDWWGVTGRKPNVHFVRTIDAEAYFELVIGCLARL